MNYNEDCFIPSPKSSNKICDITILWLDDLAKLTMDYPLAGFFDSLQRSFHSQFLR